MKLNLFFCRTFAFWPGTLEKIYVTLVFYIFCNYCSAKKIHESKITVIIICLRSYTHFHEAVPAHRNTLLIHLRFLQHFLEYWLFCLPLCKLLNTLELALLLQDPRSTVWKLISAVCIRHTWDSLFTHKFFTF